MTDSVFFNSTVSSNMPIRKLKFPLCVTVPPLQLSKMSDATQTGTFRSKCTFQTATLVDTLLHWLTQKSFE